VSQIFGRATEEMKMKKIFKILAMLQLVLVSISSVQAKPNPIEGATLGCMINASRALYIFQQERRVLISDDGEKVVPMAIEKFEVYRCPGCFGFSGTAEGHAYEGRTEGFYDENSGQWDVVLEMSVDNGVQMQSKCFLKRGLPLYGQ
jgi:hypothetical protein